MSTLRPLLLLSCVLLLAGCGKVPLFTELSETEANEMMAILLQRSIPCVKSAGKEQMWILKVSHEDFSRAVELLKSQGYPREKFAKIGDVFQKSALVSSPTEERIRYMYALSQEIAETLMRIDGVLNARVHIVIPDNDPLAEKVTPSSAAVFIRYRPGFDLESLAPQLKNLVTRSIEGLNYDNVSTVLVPAATAPAAPAGPRNGGFALGGGHDPLVLGGVLIGGVVLGGTGVWLTRRQAASRKMSLPEAAA